MVSSVSAIKTDGVKSSDMSEEIKSRVWESGIRFYHYEGSQIFFRGFGWERGYKKHFEDVVSRALQRGGGHSPPNKTIMSDWGFAWSHVVTNLGEAFGRFLSVVREGDEGDP